MRVLNKLFSKYQKISREKKYQLFLKVMKPTKKDTILDVGCGKGTFLEEKYPHKGNIIATDINEKSLKEVKKNCPKVKTKVCSGLKLPFKDKSIDIVFSNAVIEHVGNYERQKQFAKEIQRVGKKYFITTPNKWFPFEFHYRKPLIHYLPQKIENYLSSKIQGGYWFKVGGINLLSYNKFKNLFNCARVIKQRITFMPETLMAYNKNNEKQRILMLGVKEYPYGISAKFEKFPGGGTAKYVIGLSEGLAEKGHTVDLIVRIMPGQKKFEVANKVNVHRVPWINNGYLRLPSFNFFSFLRALRIIGKVDIIHTHGSFAAIYGVILSKLFGKKVIGTTHGLTSDQAKYKYKTFAVKGTKWLEKWGYSKLDKIAFLSSAEEELVVKSLGIKPKSSTIIYPGIKPLKIKRETSGKFKVVFIGRLVPMKGLDKFIKSFKLLPKSISNKIEYVIVGDGYHRPKLEELTKELKLEKKIIFIGYTNNISKYLEETSIFILPSEGGEGLPCALLEAMSAGIACMVSNFDAPMKSIVILKDNKPKTIVENIVRLFKNKGRLNRIEKNAQAEFNEKFSFQNLVNNYEGAYIRLVEK